MSRVALEFADLDVAIARAPPAVRLRIATAVAIAATERTSLDDPVVAEAVSALLGSAGCEPDLRDRVEQVVRRLDEDSWDAQEALDARGRNTVGELSEFARARAAHAVWFALDSANASDAQDAVYEAHHAIGDSERLRSIVNEQLA